MVQGLIYVMCSPGQICWLVVLFNAATIWWQDSKFILAIVSIFALYISRLGYQMCTNQIQSIDANQILIQYALKNGLNSLMK